MTERSIWGNSVPSGVTLFSDGAPGIQLGSTFYQLEPGFDNAAIVGGRVWCPVGSPPSVKIRLYYGSGGVNFDRFNLGTTPFHEVTVPTVQGGWTEARWEPLAILPHPYRWMIGYQFTGAVGAENFYVFSSSARPGSDYVRAFDNSPFVWSEAVSSAGSPAHPAHSSYFKIAQNAHSASSNWYGIDTIIEDNPPVPPNVNIFTENQKAGRETTFWHDGVGQTVMPGFARNSYYLPGQTAEFSVDYNLAFTGEVYRLGYYQGKGATLVATSLVGTPTNQPEPLVIPNSNNAVDCGNWSVNLSWEIPDYATPGWYWMLLKGLNGTDVGQVIFCVGDGLEKKPVVVVSSDATWGAAYNYYGGKTQVTAGASLYGSSGPMSGGTENRSLCVSYNRPVVTRGGISQTYFFNSEFPLIKFLERFGYEAGHITVEQLDKQPDLLDGRKIVIFSGHNEYISQDVWDKVKSLPSSTNIMNLTGNDFFWRTRYGTTDGSDRVTKGRIMWCRKDSLTGPGAHVSGMPFVDADDWGGTWQDTRWANREATDTLLGDIFIANGIRNDPMNVTSAYKTSPFWRNCAGVQALSEGQSLNLGTGLLGMEWDKPAGDIPGVRLSETTILLSASASDADGKDYSLTGTHTHHLQMLKPTGRGYIFNASTTQWAWGLDNQHDRGALIANDNVIQATLNVMADLGVSPHTDAALGSLVRPVAVTNVATAYGIPVETSGGVTVWTGTEEVPVTVTLWNGTDEEPLTYDGISN